MPLTLAVLALALSGTPTSGSPRVLVDPSVTELKTCRITSIGFRTDADGWMGDHCGGVFRSADGGRSWRPLSDLTAKFFGRSEDPLGTVGYVQRFIWLTESSGLAFTYGKPAVWRTDDGGATWARFALPSPDPEHRFPYEASEMIYDVDYVGQSIWYCGSTGTVTRSTDGGRTWTQGERLFDVPLGFNSTDWCSGLSFLDAADGWADGWRSLWRTRNGGATWEQMEPILRVVSTKAQIVGLVRLSADVAWARERDSDSMWRTLDGGKSWRQMDDVDLRPGTIRRPDGRAIVLAVAAASHGALADERPMVSDYWAAVDARTVINLGLELYVDGAIARRGPPTTPPSGKTAPLAGVVRADANSWGFSGGKVFRSEDDGRTWFRVGELPSAVTRLAALNDRSVLARVKDGLFRSDDLGRSWKRTDDFASRADWQRLTGEDAGLAEAESLECVSRGPASLTIILGVQGCFGGSEDNASLQVTERGTGQLSGDYSGWDRGEERTVLRSVNATVSADQVRAMVREIAEAAARPEVPSSCSSTTATFVKLTWRCGGSPPKVMAFETHDCSESTPLMGAEATMGPSNRASYARASGVRSVVRALLEGHRK